MRGSILWARSAAIAALIGVLAHAAPCRAQTESPTMEDPGVPVLTVKSDPPGAIIRLSGDYEFVGRAPWTLHRPLSGLYRVQAFAPGYSPWEGQVYLDPSAPQDLSVRLSRKSRFGAAARSLVIPGWGQRYNEARARGWFYTISEIGALGTAVVLWEVYQDKVDKFDSAAENYRNASDLATLRARKRDLVAASGRADDAYDDYKLALTVAGGIYAVAFVDALFGPAPAYQHAARGQAAVTEESGPSWGLHADIMREGDAQLGLKVRW